MEDEYLLTDQVRDQRPISDRLHNVALIDVRGLCRFRNGVGDSAHAVYYPRSSQTDNSDTTFEH